VADIPTPGPPFEPVFIPCSVLNGGLGFANVYVAVIEAIAWYPDGGEMDVFADDNVVSQKYVPPGGPIPPDFDPALTEVKNIDIIDMEKITIINLLFRVFIIIHLLLIVF